MIVSVLFPFQQFESAVLLLSFPERYVKQPIVLRDGNIHAVTCCFWCRAWSYHNGGSWPTLMWQFSVACIKMGRLDLAQRAVEVAEKRLSRDRWPEYYDTRSGRFVGKQARLFQTWSIAGFLVAKLLLRHPEAANWLTCDEESNSVISCGVDMNPRRRRKFNPLSNSNLV